MNELYPGRNMDVPDPWYGTEPGYHETYSLIDKACDAIIEKYTSTTTEALQESSNLNNNFING